MGDNISERVSNLERKCNVEVGVSRIVRCWNEKRSLHLILNLLTFWGRVTNLVQVYPSEF